MTWAEDMARAVERRDALRARFRSYDGGDRPMSPPVSLMRELDAAEAEVERLSRPLDVVSGVAIRKGRVLLTQRDPAKSDFGELWETPGGKVEPGETHELAVVREFGEELFVVPKVGERLASYEFHAPVVERPTRVTLYRVDLGEQWPRALVAIGIGWFSWWELVGLDLVPANDRHRADLLAMLDGAQPAKFQGVTNG